MSAALRVVATNDSSTRDAMPEALATFSPTEVAALFADRLLRSYSARSWWRWRVIRSERRVSVAEFALLTVDTLIGALVARNAVELSLRQRQGLCRSYEVAHLRLLSGVKPSLFPHRTPEARVIDWLFRQPQRQGWLDDVFIKTLIPAESPRPRRMWNHEVHRGLAARRLAREEKQTSVLYFSTMVYRLLPEVREVLAQVSEDSITSVLTCRESVTLQQQKRCREAWHTAVSLRRYSEPT